MPHFHSGRRVLTEIIAGAAFPVLLAGVLVLPISAIAVAEADRHRAQFCGAQAMPLRPVGQSWRSWIRDRLGVWALWRTDLPIFLTALVLCAISLIVSFFGFISTSVLIFNPVLWAFGIEAMVGPFKPGSTQQAWLAVPVGLLLGVVTVVILTAISWLRDACLKAFLSSSEQDLIAKLEKLGSSRASLTQAFEAERQRIERDLHDGAQQELMAVVMRLGMLEAAALAREESSLAIQATNAREQAEHALERLRQTVRDIHPRELSDFGLKVAVEELAARSPLRIEFTATGEDSLLSSPTAAAIYFSVSEALTNVAKHAEVNQARIELRCGAVGVWAQVRDEGSGGVDIAAGSGLAGLRERMHSIGGELEINSPPGAGTVVTVSAPCEPTW
ncbi:sensor histidine kinase [Arthrobacter sp. MYb227]|uniref:sensor histidine kinase n=1 Tax=Arthrobacter sp. MYb227 TaxID=1848601 RepID=UPI000CFDF067|nr:sensor histidine kinase [Arthrobacter sp. MYb227]PQZ96353.1 sensor histidine kinase [Arthrobacter sp. MYb227]